MPSTTYVARQPGPFSALVQAAEIGGLRLDPRPPVRVLDRFYDTEDGELLRRGLALRVRETGEGVMVTLRPIEAPGRAAPDLPLAEGAGDHALRLPPSPLADAVRAAVGHDALHALLTLRQYRTPRMAYDGDVSVGALSFDVVVYEVPGTRHVSNEVEVDPAPGADPLVALGPTFEAHGLERADSTKFVRGLLRMRRSLNQPVLLLPDELRRLKAAATSAPDPKVRRRAHVVLLDARGFRPDTIASQTGLSMGRVQYWREQFRDVRLALLDPEPTESAHPTPLPRDAPPPDTLSADVPPAPRPDRPSEPAAPPPEGDGLSVGPHASPMLLGDMDDLLDLFGPRAPETPFLDGPEETPAEAEGGDSPLDRSPAGVAPPPAPRLRNPYPVVLGPVAVDLVVPPPPASAVDAPEVFVEVDLRRLGRAGAASASQPGGTPSARSAARPVVSGDTPLLKAAELLIAHAVAAFDGQAERFVATRAPSDARRLLVAAHALRLTAETFEQALPEQAARRLVVALRPLAVDLDTALATARAALAAGGRADLVRQASATLASAACRLDGAREPWGVRARRLVAWLAAQRADGARRSDDAPLADDFVGAPGDAPSPTRLRHLLGSAIWRRFELVRSVEDDLDLPTTAVASHLAVALSGLRFVVSLVEPSAGAPVRELEASLVRAEEAVVAARHRHMGGDREALACLAEVWSEVTSRPLRWRIAHVVATI